MGDLTGRQLLALWAILTVGLILRVLGLGWGLPPSDVDTQQSGYRSSYALDEDDVLFTLARTNPEDMGFAPGLHSWGKLHLEVTWLALEAAEAAGAFETSWRDAFLEMQPGGFEQVYVVGRLTSAVIDLATVFLCFLLGLRLAGPRAGLWAAALLAVAPGHILQACQIRVDSLAALLATVAALALVQRAPPFGVGLLSGLAVAAKFSTWLQAAALCWMAAQGLDRRATAWAFAGAALGFVFVMGMPFVLTDPASVWPHLSSRFAIVLPIGNAAVDFLRFGLGIPAGLLALKGLWDWSRKGAVERALAIAFAAGFVAALVQPWPFLRALTPILPLGAVAAGCVLNRMGRWSPWAGAAALLIAGLISVRLVEARLATHPANLAMALIRQAGEPGERISRLRPELPPLDPAVYPLGPDPLTSALRADPPTWVFLDSTESRYPQGNLDFLESEYDRVAVFRTRPLWLWATLGEGWAPADWKYLRPEITLYKRR